MTNPDYEDYAHELAEAIRPFIESCLALRKAIKWNTNAKGELNWKNVESAFDKFEEELNKFLGKE